MKIGTIPEMYLRKVRILTLSADSGIVPDNSRITQSRNQLDKVGMSSGIESGLVQCRNWLESVGQSENLTNVHRLRIYIFGVFAWQNI